jgi:hypothetical protein
MMMKGNEMIDEASKLIAEFLIKGGTITKCRPGTPKDLYGLRYRGIMGGRRNYVAGILRRSESSPNELFERGSLVARPSTIKRA